MSSIRLLSIKTEGRKVEAVVNVSGDFDRSNGLEQNLTLTKNDQGRWVAQIALDDFPPQETPELAVQRLQLWLKTLAKSLNQRKFKKINLAEIVKTINF